VFDAKFLTCPVNKIMVDAPGGTGIPVHQLILLQNFRMETD
jgi:hypothetical protein